MGLDNYWSGKVDGEFRVCGGMLSGHGNESFRGKVYSHFVETVTGESLYDDELDNETIKKMANRLEECLDDAGGIEKKFEIPLVELEGFVAMFRAHADAGHSLTSWW